LPACAFALPDACAPCSPPDEEAPCALLDAEVPPAAAPVVDDWLVAAPCEMLLLVPPSLDALGALPPAAALLPVEDGGLVDDDWLVLAPWFIVELELLSVDDWFAATLLETLWSPLPTFTPGLMFALAFTSVLLMPTFASTPTFGLTLVEVPVGELPPAAALWAVVAPWFIVELAFVLLDDWFAVTPLVTDWSPLPMFTPGLMLAPALTSVLLMPTLASTPTLGFTSTLVCAPAGPKAPITAAAVILTANCRSLIPFSFHEVVARTPQALCRFRPVVPLPTFP